MATKKEVEQQLARAIDALDQICEVFANDEYSYPEKVGRSVVTATMALDYCGYPQWTKEFERIYHERDVRRSVQFPTPLFKVA